MKMGKRIKHFVIVIGLVIAILGVLTLMGFPLIKVIKEKNGDLEQPKCNIEKKVTYEMFMNRANEILSKVDITKKVHDLYNCTEEEIYYLLFLLNHDSLTEDAVKQLMDEKIIMNNAYDCGQRIDNSSNLVCVYDVYEKWQLDMSEMAGYLTMRDFCLGEANADFCNYLMDNITSEENYLEYYNYIVYNGDLKNYHYEGMGSVEGLKFKELPMESKMLIYSLDFYIQQVSLNGAEGYEDKFDEVTNVLMINDDCVLNSLRDSKYDQWFSMGITQVLEKYLLGN